jgi:hypothetical protein
VDARCRALILDITPEFVGKEAEQQQKISFNIVGVTVEIQTVNLPIKFRKVTSWATLLEDKQMKWKLCVRVACRGLDYRYDTIAGLHLNTDICIYLRLR